MDDDVGLLEAPVEQGRIVGRRVGQDGPTMIVLGGIHGNEPSGLRAATRVLKQLEAARPEFRGELVVIAGNLQALQEGTRFLARDLNRQWTDERVAGVIEAPADTDEPAEGREQRELHLALQEVVARARDRVFFLDLHTSSADGAPFNTIGDTLRNRKFARRFPIPVILGLEEQVDGALLEYMNNRGHITVGVEAGQHDAASSVENHEAMIWLALGAAGMLDETDIPDAAGKRRMLAERSRRIPKVIEVRHRHAIAPGDGFSMRPGFVNFHRVRKGEVIASDREGEIRAPESGRILLPLYQGKGDDGFFIAREVRPFWLKISEMLRHMRLDRFLPLLPGVRPDDEDPRCLRVDTRVARLFPLQIFHLLGYRKLRQSGRELLVSRRRFDLE